MKIGYACLTVGVPNTGMRTCTMKNARSERFIELIGNNLDSLENMIDYNIRNGILLFRISSDLIPFGSSPVNSLKWDKIFEERFHAIGQKIRRSGMRVSMHPGQYTVINSPNEDVAKRAAEDLEYHVRILDCLGTGPESKIVLHVGGVYGDKEEALRRFESRYRVLDDGIKRRLVLENDEKSYSIGEVLETALKLNIPAVYDNLHSKVNPGGSAGGDTYWIEECRKTWKAQDGDQKIHYSQQNHSKKRGSHSDSIRIGEFLEFYGRVSREDLDIMLEVKDKNISAIKCINSVAAGKSIRALELEWSRYKYLVLQNSPAAYLQIRKLLKDKTSYPVFQFYRLVEEAMMTESTTGSSVNAMQHVWGYFKDVSTEKEKYRFLKLTEDFEKGQAKASSVKAFLYRMAVKYEEHYLLDSYYFI
ncbi:MAG: UV-endonuclease UvdE [Firmicutes bacterium]|nr:UV-endonuclease UvdE [Bacillota bacterium]